MSSVLGLKDSSGSDIDLSADSDAGVKLQVGKSSKEIRSGATFSPVFNLTSYKLQDKVAELGVNPGRDDAD